MLIRIMGRDSGEPAGFDSSIISVPPGWYAEAVGQLWWAEQGGVLDAAV